MGNSASGGRRVLGFDIGGTKCTVVVADDNSKVLASRRLPTLRDRDPGRMIGLLLDAAGELVGETAAGPDGSRGPAPESAGRIGISCGGPLDAAKGLVLSPPNLPGWDEVPIKALVAARFPGVPIVLENDANASALAEWKFGAGRGTRNMIFLTFGTGLGAGLILDGKLYPGTNGMAGELGHWRMAEDGPEGYGKRGSLEGFCSGGGIARLAESFLAGAAGSGRSSSLDAVFAAGTLTAKDVAAAASEGDPLAREVIAASARTLGRALALAIDLLNPEAIVIGGIYGRAEALFKETLLEEIGREALGISAAVCRLVPAALGEALSLYAPISIV